MSTILENKRIAQLLLKEVIHEQIINNAENKLTVKSKNHNNQTVTCLSSYTKYKTWISIKNKKTTPVPYY